MRVNAKNGCGEDQVCDVLLTVALACRLLQRLRSDELSPLDSRCRVRLALERAMPDELAELLAHALQAAGAARLMTPELIATLADLAQGNPRALMNMAAGLLDAAAQREVTHIDEKLFLEMCAAPPRRRGRPGDGRRPLTGMLPVEPAWRLAERAEEHRWLVAGLWSEEAVGGVGGEPKCCKSFLALDLGFGRTHIGEREVPAIGRVHEAVWNDLVGKHASRESYRRDSPSPLRPSR